MMTFLVTGGIASGKSEVCGYLSSKGYPVYDCDSRTKALYDKIPGLKERIEKELDVAFRDLRVIFADPEKKDKLEGIVYPLVREDILEWKSGLDSRHAFIESANMLDYPLFDDLYDSVVMVVADEGKRAARNPAFAERASLQAHDAEKADYLIENNSTIEALHKEVDIFINSTMKTDLAKILTVSGSHGLYEFIAQARNGAIAEKLSDKKRTVFSGSSRISSLADIAIFTSEGEMRLAEVFTAMKAVLGDAEAPSSKAAPAEIEKLFATAIPNYDSDRFYLSHMKKVVDWYNELAKYASLDFLTDEEREAAE